MRGLPFELLLAFRYLRPKRTYVSIITLICIVGVMLGVAVLIIVMSVMSGFDVQLRDRIIGFNSHLTITQSGHWMRNYPALMEMVSTNEGVKGVAPFILSPVLIETEPQDGSGSQGMAPWLRGMDPKLEDKVSILPQSIQQGRFDVSDKGILVGNELARNLRLEVGDSLTVHSINDLHKMREGYNKKEEVLIVPDEYVVRGIFNVGHYEYDASIIVTSLEDAQNMMDSKDGVLGLRVMLNNPDQANQMREKLLRILGNQYDITTWEKDNASILDALKVEKDVMFYILFFIMVVAAFGIASALITFVVQKTREIGMLKALGATSGQVMWIFLSQSFVVGVLGVLSGLGLGMLALTYRNEFLAFMKWLTGQELFPSNIYIFDQLPALIVRKDIALICGGSLIVCLLAGLIPAWSAGRLKPVEALRHE